MVGASAPEEANVLSSNGFPQLAQKGVACALSEPHDGHVCMRNAPRAKLLYGYINSVKQLL
jgi:hypothetical protein